MQGMVVSKSTGSESNCEKCGESLLLEIELFGEIRLVPRMCRCERENFIAQKQLNENKEKQGRLETLIKNSFMDRTFTESVFEAWDFNKASKKMYTLGTKYVMKFEELKAEGLGLLIHGEPGNGKTFLSCCIANALLQKYVPAICVSINGLLSRIKETYNKWGDEAEADILRGLGKADLLIVDDLGTETHTNWSQSTIYNIIDSRYRSKLPLIITTNLQIDTNKTGGVLADMYGRRTEDRILEMCTPVENMQKSIRLGEAKKKTAILKSLFEDQS